MKKQEKGITLIALVVTIVVLLILAAVSISMLGGENGIITQAIEAREQTKIGEEKEAIRLAYESCKINNKGENVTAQQLEDELKKGKNDVTVTSEGEKLKVTFNDTSRDYEIDQNGEINQVVNSNISIKLEVVHNNVTLNANELPNVKEVTNENVPIPQGFYYVGGTKDTGVVISDVEGDDLDNTLHGNQFVWVPTNQNQALKIEVKSDEKIKEIKLYNPDGTEQQLNANGKEFNEEITIEKNGIYEVEVITASASKTEKESVTSTYGQDIGGYFIAMLNESFKYFEANAKEKYDTTSELLKAKGYNSVEELLANEGNGLMFYEYLIENSIFVIDYKEKMKEDILEMFLELYQKEFYKYIDENQNSESVNKYGGFYIGRYEAGDESGGKWNPEPELMSFSEQTEYKERKLIVQKGKYVYNEVTVDDAKKISSEMYNNNSTVTTQLISGAGWDRTMNWIIETGSKTIEEVYGDSSSWGNYNNSVGNAAIGAGEKNLDYTTGKSEYWKVNNIYDLAGNMGEWTQEKSNEKNRPIVRSGAYHSSCNSYYPSGARDTTYTNYAWDSISFRVQLFINI